MARPTTSYVCSAYNLLRPLLTLDASLPQYEWKLDTDRSPAVEALFNLAKSRLPAALEAKFAAFPAAIIDTHGKDLTVSADPSRQGSPAPSSASATAAKSTQSDAALKKRADGSGAVKSSGVAVNTTRVTVDAHFMAPADDLFGLLTDESRIPHWTRAPAKVLPDLWLSSRERFADEAIAEQGGAWCGVQLVRRRRKGQVRLALAAEGVRADLGSRESDMAVRSLRYSDYHARAG